MGEQTEREIEMVRNEISMLKRKDRQHVLPYIPERPSLRSTTAPDGARRLSGGLGGENLPSMNSGAGGNKEDGDRELIRDKENRGVNRLGLLLLAGGPASLEVLGHAAHVGELASGDLVGGAHTVALSVGNVLTLVAGLGPM